MDPILIVLKLFRQNPKFKSGGPGPCDPPGSATYASSGYEELTQKNTQFKAH